MPVKFSCPHCGQHLEAEDELAGSSCLCPACNKEFVTGAASEGATATTPAALATESPAPGGLVAGSGTNSGAQCRNHPGVPAAARCAGCQESFCTNCLVDLAGRQYCGSCKVMAVKNAPVLEEATIPCKEAGEALTMAIVGIFCFGIILAPMALVKASKARKMIAADPRLAGSGKVTAAQIIAVVVLVLTVIGFIAKISQLGNM